ncbi:MAG: hypothetical protein QT05_C0013G0011 [archaeon GW2011_AR13]|nr:MAG: hypothetical protein QT05_C0013G0011 [archaeon GW2011_AR13]HIG94990.1 DUF86 domain-containing protein [Nanoarchaeota archaeon]HIH62898.1 DUF86 domain-containing protein [Nanoarchaeota archaeon]HIJ10315.1 DUF86 domain-containing protein [Nanoarchaeota archaeon]
MNRINEKIIEVEQFLEELESCLPDDFIEYKQDFKIRAIGERYFEKIIEAIIDIAFLIIKEKNLKQPEYEKQVFDILFNNKIISQELSLKLQDAKGMRNIIAHEYGKVDDELIFHSLTEELIIDSYEFIKQIEKVIKKCL